MSKETESSNISMLSAWALDDLITTTTTTKSKQPKPSRNRLSHKPSISHTNTTTTTNPSSSSSSHTNPHRKAHLKRTQTAPLSSFRSKPPSQSQSQSRPQPPRKPQQHKLNQIPPNHLHPPNPKRRATTTSTSTSSLHPHHHHINKPHQPLQKTHDGFSIPQRSLKRAKTTLTTHSHSAPPPPIYLGEVKEALQCSEVLDRNDYEFIYNVKNLFGATQKITKERIKAINQQFTECLDKDILRWAGLCQYDPPQRVLDTIQSLQQHKKSVDAEMIAAFRKKENDDIKKKIKNSIKSMSNLLDSYKKLVRVCRENEEQNKKLLKEMRINQHQQGPHRVKRGPIRPEMVIQFGRDKERENYKLPFDFCTAFRGHNLNDAEYEKYVRLRKTEQGILDDDDDKFDDDDAEYDDDSDVDMNDVHGLNQQSLLGESVGIPPQINAVNRWRNAINGHLGAMNDTLRDLYGDDFELYSTNNLRYKAHLLSDFEIIERVGSGVYGQVFRAKSKKTGKLVAVKALQLIMNRQQRAMQVQKIEKQRRLHKGKAIINEICPFILCEGISVPVIREITGLKQLSQHPNISKLYDVVLNDPSYLSKLPRDDPLRNVIFNKYGLNDQHNTVKWNFHLIQEFISFELCSLMKNLKISHCDNNMDKDKYRKITEDKAYDSMDFHTLPKDPYWFSCANVKSILKDLLNGLQHMKSQSYVHRDLKPANILLTEDGIVKIADFGLSRPYYIQNRCLTNNKNVVTRFYRAPEILIQQNRKRSRYSFSSDMWSIGAIFAEILVGRPVFRASSDLEQLNAIIWKCGAIKESNYEGVDKIVTKDPPPNWKAPIDPKTNKEIPWEKTQQAQMQCNFLKYLAPKWKTHKANISTFLKPYIQSTWSSDNMKHGLDLIEQMLCYDPIKRIDPEQALKHPFFQISPMPQRPTQLIQISKKVKKSSHTDLQQQQMQHKQQQNQRQQQLQHQQHGHNGHHNGHHGHNGYNPHHGGHHHPMTQPQHRGGDNRHRGSMNQNGSSQRRVIGQHHNNYNNYNGHNNHNNNNMNRRHHHQHHQRSHHHNNYNNNNNHHHHHNNNHHHHHNNNNNNYRQRGGRNTHSASAQFREQARALYEGSNRSSNINHYNKRMANPTINNNQPPHKKQKR